MLDTVRPGTNAERSVCGRAWRLPPGSPPASVPDGVDPRAAAIAAARGVDDLDAFFRPTFKACMPDPSSLAGMDDATALVAAAVRDGRKIGLIGDYDVDGATSTALVARFLELVGHRALAWTIPHRLRDGYGPNPGLVARLHEAEALDVLVVLDSGTTSFEAIDEARRLGMDVVVIDHHEPSPRGLPDAIVVNPKRPGGDRAYEYLCTVGLAFLFCVSLKRELLQAGRFGPGGVPAPDVRDLLGLVALGTVADVVPLVGLNRAYAYQGFGRMHRNVGVAALAKVTGKPEYNAHTCGFVFGPSLNAAGRIEDMRMSVDLLVATDEGEALDVAERLHDLNQVRRKLTLAAIERAKEMVASDEANHRGVVVLHDEDWHPGIVGLVAAKVREFYDRPAVAIGTGGKGSCRSVDGYHIGSAVIAAAETGLLQKGGGHAMAAGLTVDASRVHALKLHLDAAYEGHVAPPTPVDAVLQCGEATPALVGCYEQLAPFGMGNPRPRVALVGGRVRKVEVIKLVHVKAWVSGPRGETVVLAFSGAGTPVGDVLANSRGRRIDVLGTLATSTYAGVETAFLKPEDVIVRD